MMITLYSYYIYCICFFFFFNNFFSFNHLEQCGFMFSLSFQKLVHMYIHVHYEKWKMDLVGRKQSRKRENFQSPSELS